MVKDPWWIYAYWEIQPSTERAARSQLLPNEVPDLKSVLRVYDVTGIDFPSQPAQQSFDIGLSGLATNWYIQTNAPNHSFVVDVGLLTHTGRFLLLARSNRVTTPRFGPSDALDEEWMAAEEAFWKLFGVSAGIGIGSSPTSWAKLLQQRLFSGARSSFSLAKASAVKGFWCRLNADLVIHGATEPKAAVTVQGQPVAVRKDGTFSLRMTLPDGTKTITVEVRSADGQQTQTFSPLVTLGWSGTLSPGGSPPQAPSSHHQFDPRSRGERSA